MRVYAPAPFRYSGTDYPFGYQEVTDALGDVLKSAGYVLGTAPSPGGVGVTTFAALTDKPQNNAKLAVSLGLNRRNAAGAIAAPINGNIGVGTNAGSGRCVDQQLMALGAFSAVRLVYYNWDTANPLTINRAVVAPAGVSATANGSGLTWAADVTFAGSGSVVIPAATTVQNSKVRPGIVISDFAPVRSIARSDGGTLPILRVRTSVPDSTNVPSPLSGTLFGTDSANPGFLPYAGYASIASAALTTGSASPGSTSFGACPAEVIYYYDQGVYEIAGFGDSLLLGSTTTSNNIGFLLRAMFVAQQAGTPLTTFCHAVNGMAHTDYCSIALDYLAKFSPTFLYINSWSPNDSGSTTQAGADAQWAQTLNVIETCRQKGVIPIVSTPFPNTGMANITTYCARVMALPEWVLKLDANSILNNGTPTTYNAIYNTDNTHTNDLGHGALSAALLALLPI